MFLFLTKIIKPSSFLEVLLHFLLIFRFSYDPEPESEEELSVQAGDYLLVWGEPAGPGGYLDAELLDGRRGLVPSNFAQRLIGKLVKNLITYKESFQQYSQLNF